MGDGSDPMWPMAMMLIFRWFNFVAYSGQILTVIDRYQRHFCTQTPQVSKWTGMGWMDEKSLNASLRVQVN